MGQMHEVLAVVPTLKGAAQKILNETSKMLNSKPQLFNETLKTYHPLEESEMTNEPPDMHPMSTTVGQKLSHLAEIYGPYVDALFQVDMTNLEAKADIDVGGFQVKGIPSTFLMQLDKKLTELRQVYDGIPTLDPKHDWKTDEGKGKGIFKAEDETTYRTKKVTKHKVVTEAIAKDGVGIPAQIHAWNEDERCGKWITKRWSGMITVSQKYEILKRIDMLHQAVKKALSEANRVEHSTDKIAGKLFDYLHGGIE